MSAPMSGAGGVGARAKQKVTEVLAGFTHGQRAMVGIAVLTAIIGGYAFISWASKPTYAPLFSNLQASDASAITQKLSAAKVPYHLADGGSTILVPQSDVYQERLDMSSAGLPSSSGSGYTLLDKAGITTSDFQQQVEYQQAVQTELDNTIGAMTGVTSAVVHVVIPQQSLFGSSSGSASASVMLELQPGVVLTSTQVQAIVHLVASSIENLDPSNVTVVDSKGDVLSAPGSNAAMLAAGDAQAQQTQQYDQGVNTSLEQMLAPVVGAGNVVVDTAATLDYNQTSTTSKAYTGKPIPVSSSTSAEKYTGAAANSAAGGTLGTAVTSTGTSGTGAPSTYTNSTTNTSNAVGEVDQTVQNAPGSVQRMSVAVMINSSVKGVTPATIRQLVSAAVGLQPARGDTLAVTSLPFAATAPVTATKAAKSSSNLVSEGVTGVLLLVVLAMVFLALRKLRKPTRTPIDLSAELAASPAALGAGEIEPPTMALPAVMATPAVAPPPVAALGEMIDSDPARIAELLRDWLAEDRA